MYNFNNNIATPHQQQQQQHCETGKSAKSIRVLSTHTHSLSRSLHVKFYIM